MRFEEFEARAYDDWERIPATYKEGIDGLRVERRALPHPDAPDVFTLGECVTEAYPSDFGGPDTIRSVVVLYHGSFRRLAGMDPEFDWEHELWETLTHELRHHLESLAAEDALEDVDYAADQNFRRLNGEPFDPFFYQRGEAATGFAALAMSASDARRRTPDAWRVESDVFVELEYRSHAPTAIELDWHGSRWRVSVPAGIGDVTFLVLEEPFEPPPTSGPTNEVALVLVRRAGVVDTLRRLLSRRPLDVSEHAVAPEPLEPGPDASARSGP